MSDVIDPSEHKAAHDEVLRLSLAAHFYGVRGQAIYAKFQEAQAAMEQHHQEGAALNEQLMAAAAKYAETAAKAGVGE